MLQRLFMDLCLLKRDVKLQLTNYGLVQDVSGTHRVFGDASEALTIPTQTFHIDTIFIREMKSKSKVCIFVQHYT